MSHAPQLLPVEEEFSSSSSGEESSDWSDSESSGVEAEDECSAAFENSALGFFADDGVSDIGEDDAVSDIDDQSVQNFDVDDEELTEASRTRGRRRRRAFSLCSGGCGSSLGSEQSIGSVDTMRSNSRPPSARGSITSDGISRNSSQCRALRKASTELEVGRLRQGRLNNRRLESDVSTDDRSMSVDLTTLSTKSDHASQSAEVQASSHVSACLFVDISGFTKLSRSLEVEALSEIINSYFQLIVSEIKAYGGDILKFSGDALMVEWTKEMLPPGQQHLSVTLLAALCASSLVDKYSDYPVEREGEHISTLNLHCAVGFGNVVGAHVVSQK